MGIFQYVFMDVLNIAILIVIKHEYLWRFCFFFCFIFSGIVKLFASSQLKRNYHKFIINVLTFRLFVF